MKNAVKVSSLSMFCILCMAGLSSAYGAASVRTLGGTNTYSSASGASAARAGSSAVNAARLGTTRTTPTRVSSVGSRVASSPSTSRLSIGSYLNSGKTVQGGSSIKSQNPGSSSSTGNGSGSSGEVDLSGIEKDISDLQKIVDALQKANDDMYPASEIDALLDLKQDILNELNAGAGIDITDGVISVTIEDGEQIVLQKNDTHIQWKYEDEPVTAWRDLVALSELVGPIGPEGPAGPQGEPGGVPDDYMTSTEIAIAIANAITAAGANYATVAQGALADTALQPGNAPDGADYVPVVRDGVVHWFQVAYPGPLPPP